MNTIILPSGATLTPSCRYEYIICREYLEFGDTKSVIKYMNENREIVSERNKIMRCSDDLRAFVRYLEEDKLIMKFLYKELKKKRANIVDIVLPCGKIISPKNHREYFYWKNIVGKDLVEEKRVLIRDVSDIISCQCQTKVPAYVQFKMNVISPDFVLCQCRAKIPTHIRTKIDVIAAF